MRIRVLGPLSIETGAPNGVPSAPKQRQVLALLLLDANSIRPTSDFIRELWDDKPPASAITSLQTYIMQLRSRLSAALGVDRAQVARDILVTTPVGYMFRVGAGQLDLDLYLQRKEAGQRALALGRFHEAIHLLAEAVGLWHGPPLVDVRAGHLLQMEIRKLEESRLHTAEQLIDARLGLGQHGQLLGELTWLTDQHPMHENLHAKLMLALYRAGRRSQALEVFRRLRNVLIDELGLEPCRQIQVLHRAILSADPKLDLPT
jgi:DNA-binding SARP family transcriptional activator